MLCDRPIPEAFRRGPDRRSDPIRKRVRIRIREKLTKTKRKPCPKCWHDGQRGWAKGFCNIHAKEKGLEDPRRNHTTGVILLKVKELKVKERKPGMGAQKKLKKAEATSQAKYQEAGAGHEESTQAEESPRINASEKQKQLMKKRKKLTQEEVEAKNLEIMLLKPVEGFAKAAMDSDTEAEFFRAPAGDIRRLGEPQAEWMDSDDEWESGRCMLCRRRVLDDLEQLNLDLCEEDFQKRRKPEPLVPAWQWFDNETEQLDCAHDLHQAMVESRPDQEAAVRRQDEEEILRLKHLDAVERRAQEISVHKAQLQRKRQGTELTRLEFDAVDFYWDPPPPGRLMWSED